ncbi:MAG: NADH-quinone oxidoreductase subunit L, partial [Pirellulales bacterium]
MDPDRTLPILFGLAWLLPLASFALIVLFGPRMGKAGIRAGYVATGAILASFVLSAFALFFVWLPNYDLPAEEHPAAAASSHGNEHGAGHEQHDAQRAVHEKPAITGDWYTLGKFGALRITIGYYIDSLTVLMFFMVTFIATCIHFYAYGYMHEELHEVTDHEVTLAGGHHLHRRGRFHRFFQYLSLFCFSMLGIVIAGNMAMVFV